MRRSAQFPRLLIAGLCVTWPLNGCGTTETIAPPGQEPLPFLTPTSAIVVGGTNACHLAAAGVATCWGGNGAGEIGDGTTVTRLRAVTVSMPSGVTVAALAAGVRNTCALSTTGRVYCWGDNDHGQLGDGTWSDRPLPDRVQAPPRVAFKSLAAGTWYNCAIATTGSTYCWGRNNFGKLGDGTTASQATPTAVIMPQGLTFSSVSLGRDHTCGLTSAGAAYCWGRNFEGQLGDGSPQTNQPVPVAVALSASVRFTALALGGWHSCGLTSAGMAYCWGLNTSGQTGIGVKSDSQPLPSAVAMPAGVTLKALAAAAHHTCAVTASGGAYCWGHNLYGQLGVGDTITRALPVAVALPAGVTLNTISAGGYSTCGMTSDSIIYCWGENVYRQLGDGTTTHRRTPVKVAQP